jgi:hypothetical protein
MLRDALIMCPTAPWLPVCLHLRRLVEVHHA